MALKEKQEKSLVLPKDLATRPIIDYYPLDNSNPGLVGSEYDIPMPQQVFSSGTSNEVRMHRLGEIRWVYVETLPSSAWPMMNDFWVTSGFGLAKSDPTTGIIESDNLSNNDSNNSNSNNENLKHIKVKNNNNLKKFSPKYYEIINRIYEKEKEEKDGCLYMVYSNFKTCEGLGLFAMALEQNGFARYKVKKHNKNWVEDIEKADEKKPKFAIYAGDESAEEREIIRNVFNNKYDLLPDAIKKNVVKRG